VAILAPEDERDLADRGWAGEVRTYSPGSLTSLTGPIDAAVAPLRALLRDLGVAEGPLGYEDRGSFEGSPYAATFLFQTEIRGLLARSVSEAARTSGADIIARLRSSLTAHEVEKVRLGCRIAGEAFAAAVDRIRPGAREPEVARAVAGEIEVRSHMREDVVRAEAFAWCMSGPNSALAGAAYARTRDRELREGDLVLVHCNSTVDGYWTDITRTYCLGEPDERKRAIYDAIFAARSAALAMIRPGTRAADVDCAARDALTEHGLGEYFTHGVGHNVGFSVISADFPPRLHPTSPDVLEAGMTFNIEPSVYIQGFGGIRHCDVVTVHADGPEILTPFQGSESELILVD
jgi:Xaa-Pro aminopeptidase